MEKRENFFNSILISAALLLVFFAIYNHFGNNFSPSFFIDEYSWIARGYFFELLLKGDFDNPLWDTYVEGPMKGIDGDPKLASYIYGLTLYPDYLKVKSQKKEEYNMVHFLIDNNFFSGFINRTAAAPYRQYRDSVGSYPFWNRKAGDLSFSEILEKYGVGFNKTIKTIMKARKASYLATALSVVFGYYLGLLIFRKPLISALVALFYGSSHLVVVTGTKAATEGLFLLLFNLSLLLLVYIFSKAEFRMFPLLAFAASVALLNQTKLNGVMLLFIFNFFAIVKLAREAYFKRWQLRLVWGDLAKALAVNLVFLIIYVASNPFLYKNTIRNISFQYKWTYEVTQNVRRDFLEDSLKNPQQRLKFIFSTLFGDGVSLTPFVLRNDSLPAQTIVRLALIFFLLGAFKLGRRTLIEFKLFFKKKNFSLSSGAVFFIGLLLILIIMLSYLLVGWDRYLVHLVLPVYLMVFLFFFEVYKDEAE